MVRNNKFCKVEKETDLQALEMYKQGMSLTNIAKTLCIHCPSLSKRLKNMGLQLRPNRTYDCDLDYFATIDSEHKAYWLGFISADGCVNKDKTFEITLKAEDRYLLEALQHDIQSNAPITNRIVKLNGYTYEAVRLTINRKQFGQCLIQKGIVPNKSAIIRVPFDDIPISLMNHFIRGYFDGNGCISIANRNDGKSPTRNAVTVVIGSGNLEMLHDIQLVLDSESIHFTILDTHNGYHEMRLFKNIEKERFFNYIYEGATIFLERKHVKYMQFAAMRRRSSKSS